MGGVARRGDVRAMTKNILILGHAIVATRMASPGIRTFNHARVIASALPDAHVTLALPQHLATDLDPSSLPFEMVWPSPSELRRLVAKQDVIITAKFPVKLLPFASKAKLVLDLYTPFYTEWMEMSKYDPSPTHRRALTESKRKNLMAQIAAADVLLCANERQRDLLLGIVGTLGLVMPREYDRDPSLEGLLKICPLGIRAASPAPREPKLKGVYPGIGKDDFVLIWNGTIIEWYDIDLLIRALHRVVQKHPHVKLFFMGTEHPDSFGSKPLSGLGGGATRAAMQLSEELGILDKNVFFNIGWANNEEAESYLLESDASVCTYFDNLETRYSFRVRYLDVIWASLPMVCTKGDVVAEMVDDRGLGLTVPEGGLDELVAALLKLVEDDAFRAECRANMGRVREEFSWERTLAPLVEFCRNPETALPKRSERWLPVLMRTADWLVSQGYYNARWIARGRLTQMLRKR
jgi:glycosyltransferase involved in cell wall biosynthesis